ncbi:prominin-like protein isoform X1 [Drosophila pseudoobscura]|uniref:Prominin-like protein isoform X1 n=1 Tax=Drosophila pseudoobscura pseudoobscura TaxID=46245 RepID=A0A6I8VMP4_DROPS|nr:prominin-like protein isoform X1 [Drosophila pseudoobscura]
MHSGLCGYGYFYWLLSLFWYPLQVFFAWNSVVYFCLCCHRCKLGCPACQSDVNRRRILWSICLLLILPFIAGSMGLAFLSNGMLERGLDNTKIAIEMGSVDTCNFLKDVSDHIRHLFVKNYQELETHLVTTIVEAPKHLFKDLNDVAEGNAVAELNRIIGNIVPAIQNIKLAKQAQADTKEVSLRLRNALRGVKRDVNHAAVVLCGSFDCMKFLQTSGIEYMDTSRCLHLDEVPESDRMLVDLNNMYKDIKGRPGRWIARLRGVSKKIKDEMARVSPPIIRDIRKGGVLFTKEAARIEEIIDVVMSDIHIGTMRASRAFEDLYDKFNETRQYVVQYIAVSLLGILSILVLSLIVGCLAPRPTGASNEYFTKRIAAYMMILAMILIYCALSVMLGVVLFYFVIGGVAYKGACAPLREMKSSALLKQLDSEIDLRTMFSFRNMDVPAVNVSADPIRVSSVIKACQGNDYLFNFLDENRIFDIDDFLRLRIVTPVERKQDTNLDLSKEFILTEEDRNVFLNRMENTEGGLFHSDLWLDLICEDLSILNLDHMGQSIRALGRSLSWNNYAAASVAFENAYVSLVSVKANFYYGLEKNFRLMAKHLKIIDEAVLYENYNLGDSIKILKEKVVAAEKFIRDQGTSYITSLGQNLTAVVEDQIKNYIRMIVREAQTKIGYCRPLTYIYDRGLELVCNRMVDPINGYWMGVVMAAFLLMPVLCISHRLQCLYKQHKVPPIRAIRATHTCPFCNGDLSRTSGGHIVVIGPDSAETKSFHVENTIEEIVNINDGDGKNKLD